MQYTPFDLMGVVVQWSSGVLLLLLFLRLGHFGARRELLRTWVAAWAALTVSITGFFLKSAAILIGQPLAVGTPVTLLDQLYIPGKLLFSVLVALGAWRAAGRPVRRGVPEWIAAAAVAVGAVAILIGDSAVSGAVLLGVTVIAFIGSALVLSWPGSPRSSPQFRFLAGSLMLYGLVAGLYQVGSYFGSDLGGAFGATITAVSGSSGYGDGLVSAILGAAVLLLIIDDAFRAAAYARDARERDLATSEAHLTAIIHAAREAIVTIDAHGRILLANPATDMRFGLPAGAAAGRLLSDFVETGDSIRMLIDAGADPADRSTRSTATLNAVGRRADGSTFPLECTVGSLGPANGSGSVVILRDLTARRAAEVEREAFERRLAESEKMTAIGRVVSGVAHELNNPLAVVLGQSEHLVGATLDPGTRDGLQLIQEQAHRARHIVRDLLAFVRQRDEPREPIDLDALIRRVVASQVGSARAQGVTVDIASDGTAAEVQSNSVAIEQILVNLVDNGITAAGPGGRVLVRLRTTHSRVEVAVEDSGTGVPAALVTRIFEPFFTTKPEGQGTGLGLPVSAGLAERSGGSLRLDQPGGTGSGAVFVLTFPRPISASSSTVAPNRPRTHTLPRPPRRRGGKSVGEVLVVDDEAAIRSTLSRIFHRGGWQVREATTGEEALSWLVGAEQSKSPDLVLCDLHMPGMNGLQVYRYLQERYPRVAERFVMMTGDVIGGDELMRAEPLACPLVEKPFTVAEIARAVEQVMQNGGPSEDGPPLRHA
jgi:PAS domain S-box-containing protein